MAARNPTPVFRGAIIFLAVYFRIKQDGLSKRGNSIVFYERSDFFNGRRSSAWSIKNHNITTA